MAAGEGQVPGSVPGCRVGKGAGVLTRVQDAGLLCRGVSIFFFKRPTFGNWKDEDTLLV